MSGRRPAGLVLAAAGVASALAYFLAVGHDLAGLRLVAKPLPALVLAAWVAPRRRDALGRFVAAGLLLSAVGDAVLELGHFLPGLGAFLVAHVAYTAGFVAADARPALARALPFAAFGAFAFAELRPGLGVLALPVGVYVAVICTMMWRASARVGGPTPASAAWIGLAGAVAFAASDTLIAVDRFSAPIPGAGGPIMLLYWLGQWGIAASAAMPGGPESDILPRR